jgi:hypothetical protein
MVEGAATNPPVSRWVRTSALETLTAVAPASPIAPRFSKFDGNNIEATCFVHIFDVIVFILVLALHGLRVPKPHT